MKGTNLRSQHAPHAVELPLGSQEQHVSQGEVRIATSADTRFSTILGSCIATVIWDRTAQVGGMNHILLPSSTGRDPANHGLEINLMELLINGVLAAGAHRATLRAKIFGGARMIDGLGTTGGANAAFASRFLENEGIPCVAQSTGGRSARRLRVWPATGRVQQLRLRRFDEIPVELTGDSLRTRALRFSGVELL